MRRLGQCFRAFITILICWASIVALGAIIPGTTEGSDSPHVTAVKIGLEQGTIHTDFLLPLDDLTRRDFAVLDLPETAEWLLVGWGAREFYTTVGAYSDISLSALWSALSGDRAVMRFEAIESRRPEMIINLDRDEYKRLRQVILSETDFTRPIGKDLLRQGDQYFAAKGNFNAINTCNQWIAHSLKHAGYRFGLWTQTTWAVRLSWWIYG